MVCHTHVVAFIKELQWGTICALEILNPLYFSLQPFPVTFQSVFWEKIYPFPCAEVFLTHQLGNLKHFWHGVLHVAAHRFSPRQKRGTEPTEDLFQLHINLWLIFWERQMNETERRAVACCLEQVMNASGETVQAACRNAGLWQLLQMSMCVLTVWNKMETLNGGAGQTSRMTNVKSMTDVCAKIYRSVRKMRPVQM